jgi:hypothetical protein
MNKFSDGELARFKFSYSSATPILIIGSRPGHSTCFYDVYIPDIGIVRSVMQEDLRKLGKTS